MKKGAPIEIPIRKEPLLPEDAELIRGGLAEFQALKDSVDRTFSTYGVYGFSTFCIPGLTPYQVKAQKWQINQHKLRVAKVSTIRALNYGIIASFSPHHYTIVINSPLTQTIYSVIDSAFSPPFDVRFST